MDDPYSEPLHQARQALHKAAQLLNQEIADYPGPIAGCDAQFNHLLADRRRIAAAMAALQADEVIPSPRWPGPQTENSLR